MAGIWGRHACALVYGLRSDVGARSGPPSVTVRMVLRMYPNQTSARPRPDFQEKSVQNFCVHAVQTLHPGP